MKKKLKDLLRESNVWDRKFGESLPTLKQCAEKHAAKQKIQEKMGTYKHSVKLIAHRMELHKEFGKTWAKKILKDPKYRNCVSERDLQNDLPDYFTGRGISELFKGLREDKLTEAFEGVSGHIITPKVFGRGEGFSSSPKKQINVVGDAPRHKKWMMEVERGEGYYRSIVENYADFLKQQGHKNEAKELMSKYVTLTGKFSNWMKTNWVRIVRKLI